MIGLKYFWVHCQCIIWTRTGNLHLHNTIVMCELPQAVELCKVINNKQQQTVLAYDWLLDSRGCYHWLSFTEVLNLQKFYLLYFQFVSRLEGIINFYHGFIPQF